MTTRVIQITGIEEKPSVFAISFINGKVLYRINISIAAKEDGTFSCVSLHISSDTKLGFIELLKLVDSEIKLENTDIETIRVIVGRYDISGYDSLVPMLISIRYTFADELSCHRKALLGEEEPLDELNGFVTYCKDIALQIFNKN